MADGITLPVVFGVVGAGCVIAAVTGGGFKILVDFPSLRGWPRILAGFAGVAFILLAFWSYQPKTTADSPVTPPTASPTTGVTGPPISTPPQTRAPTPTPTPAPAVEFEGVLVVGYIDNMGYIDIDGHKAWRGDEDEPSDAVDIGVDAQKVQAEGVARIALSESGGKAACLAAIEREAPSEISMGQVQDDKGFCAISRGGKVAYVRYMNLAAKDADHFLQVRLTVYG